jgi:MSHA pilin protein MshC
LRPAASRGTRFDHGFTMVELIVVIVLIGIIGTVAAGRFFERSTFDANAWAEQVKATLRYAQKVAVAQNQSVYVHLTPERVAVCLDPDPACASDEVRLRAPGGANSGSPATRAACGSASWMCEGRPAGVSMGLPGNPAGAPGSVAFDGLGRARMIGGFGGRLEIGGDGIARTIGVDAETGYVD